MSMSTITPELVILDWKDIAIAFNDNHGDGQDADHDGFSSSLSLSLSLSSSSLSPTFVMEALERALGENGMGLVAIRNVPGFVAAKQAFLPQAHKLVKLPIEYLEGDELTDKESLYNAGWSHGKEKLGDGVADLAKGSFYFNPITDLPGSVQDRATYPLSYPKNKWPSHEMVGPDFKNQAVILGCLLKNVVVTLCRHVDALAAQKVGAAGYPADFLYNVMKDTEKVKARLLYYFPMETTTTETTKKSVSSSSSSSSSSADCAAAAAAAEDSWTGWHLDSGFLTALAGDFYVNHETGEILKQSPDPNSGLYIVDRHDQVRHVHIPPDCLAVQIGECTQICTGGAVVATPHCVRGCGPIAAAAAAADSTTTTTPLPSHVARISMPCFIDTPPTFPLSVPHGSSREQVLQAGLQNCRRVPPLEQRWTKNGMTFGDFLNDTFAMYYDWKPAPAETNDNDDDNHKKNAATQEATS